MSSRKRKGKFVTFANRTNMTQFIKFIGGHWNVEMMENIMNSVDGSMS